MFNQWAALGSVFGKQSTEPSLESKTSTLFSSQIKPDLGNMQLVEVTDFNKEKASSRSANDHSLAALKDGVYLLKVSENSKEKMLPYIRITPKEIAENEIVQSENNAVLKLKIDENELSAVHIFDENKDLVKTVSKDQYEENGGISLKDLDTQKYTFEIITPIITCSSVRTLETVNWKTAQIFLRRTDRSKPDLIMILKTSAYTAFPGL